MVFLELTAFHYNNSSDALVTITQKLYIMTRVQIHPSAIADLDDIDTRDEDSAALIIALLQEFQDTPGLSTRLTEAGYRDLDDPAFEIKNFAAFKRQGQTVYILKIWDMDGSLVPYRVIYFLHPQHDVAHVVAVIHRQVDYERDQQLMERLRADYEKLAIPTFRAR